MCSYDHRQPAPNPASTGPHARSGRRTAHNRELSRISDVADHFPAGRVSGEIPWHMVGDVVLLAAALGEAEPSRPRLARLQAQWRCFK